MRKLHILAITAVLVVNIFSGFSAAYGRADEYLCDMGDGNCYQCKSDTKYEIIFVKGPHRWDGETYNNTGTCYKCRENGNLLGDWVWREVSCCDSGELASCTNINGLKDAEDRCHGKQIYAPATVNGFIYRNPCLGPLPGESTPAESTPTEPQTNKSCNVRGVGRITHGETRYNIDCSTVPVSRVDPSLTQHGNECAIKCGNGAAHIAVTSCKDGWVVDTSKPSLYILFGGYRACIQAPSSGGGNGGGARPSCVVLNKCSLNPNADECRACCTVRPADAVSWNRSTYKCECRDRTKQFDVASATCVAQGAAPTTYECPTETMTEINKWAIDCVAKPEIISLITEIRTYCTSPGRTAVGFSELYERLTALNPQNCEKINNAQQLCSQISDASMVDGECKCNDADKVVDETKKQCVESPEARARREAEEAAARQRTSQAKIVAISTKMETISSALKDASVWKDKEGNFNTARLASDSIAGVVLGTAGGLITSNVVKKNQIKGGFENLSCTIGGQVVASYGDEFSVGINTNAW